MIEILALIAAVGGIGTRAKQRRVNEWVAGSLAVGGWVILLVVGNAVFGAGAVILRWLWVGAVYLFIELAHGAKKAGDTWRCPECRLYNDPGTLVCLCGFENPETS